MRSKNEMELRLQRLNHRLINLELVGCARTKLQDEEMLVLKGAYDALLWSLGCSENCKAVRL